MKLFLLPENVARRDGASAEFALDAARCKPLLLTLGITRIVQQESLEISIWGSSDQQSWEPLQVFPQKFYCGTYSMLLELDRHPHIRYLRAQWKMNRWGSTEEAPLFGFYILMEEPTLHAVGA
jgi:hypothetical protein